MTHWIKAPGDPVVWVPPNGATYAYASRVIGRFVSCTEKRVCIDVLRKDENVVRIWVGADNLREPTWEQKGRIARWVPKP